MNPAAEKELREQLDIWLKEGIVQPSSSPWSSPLVLVKKKDGGVRYAVDYRQLNDVCVPDSYPLPRISETLDKLSGKKVFSTLDASSAYWNIPLHPESCELTAFSTPWGLFEFRYMPFGLTSAGAVYSRFIGDVIINDTNEDCTSAYLDDVICGTEDSWGHLKELRVIFAAHLDDLDDPLLCRQDPTVAEAKESPGAPTSPGVL